MRFSGLISLFFVSALAVAQTAPTVTQGPRPIPSPPSVSASSYLLVDGRSGEILVEHNADTPLPPASLTKLMTAYLVEKELQSGVASESDLVNVSVKAWRTEGSRMFIREGTQVSLGDLLRGIIIQSGNDASVAVAEHFAGSEDAFAELMTAEAQAMGMTQTQYYNATGLPDEGHLTTARDLSILARRIIFDHPDLYSLYSTREFTYNDITQQNRNRLLWRDPSVDGLKTGHTQEAGYCLVASAERDGFRLISVVMGTSSPAAREQETSKLLSYGFRFFEGKDLLRAGTELAGTARVWGGELDNVSLAAGQGVYATLPKGAAERVQLELILDGGVDAPVTQGQALGQLVVSLDGEVLAEVPAVAAANVASGGLMKQAMDWVLKAIQ